jgi:hypothetical protein
MSLAQVEAELIRQTLANVTSNRAEAAKKLGSGALWIFLGTASFYLRPAAKQ